jgi:hypothetical protein
MSRTLFLVIAPIAGFLIGFIANPVRDLYSAFLTGGAGALFGILIGLLLYLVAKRRQQ